MFMVLPEMFCGSFAVLIASALAKNASVLHHWCCCRISQYPPGPSHKDVVCCKCDNANAALGQGQLREGSGAKASAEEE